MGKNGNDNGGRRQQAIEELQRLVRDQRARLDPDVLARVAEALGGTQPAAQPSSSVPYDRDAATRAIELFLAQHKDKADFRARLFAFIKQQSN